MSDSWRVGAYDELVAAALEEARGRRVYPIVRLQDIRARGLLARNGKLESMGSGRWAAVAVQVFTPAGHSGFASSDELTPAEAGELVHRAADLAGAAARAGAEANPAVYELRREARSCWPSSARRVDAAPLNELRAALLDAHREAVELASGFAVSSSLGLTDDEWRVARGDGTDVRFRMPRADIRHSFTARGSAATSSATCTVSGADDRVALKAECRVRLGRRAAQALQRARDAADGSRVELGCYRVVLDYRMAKGLAHEAFGHPSESDSARNSILATDGRLRLGERLADPSVSIVDGPIEGDYAYQPVSANGVPRQTVEIVRAGRLNSGLGDLFSAARAGTPLTGAARAASVSHRALPRISNIRLVLDRPAALSVAPELLYPSEVRDHLEAAGLLPGSTPTLYLAGYRGGQVSKVNGDFVFNCAVAYELSDGCAPRGPATFSGKSRSALASIVGALGDLQLDAGSHCVKLGQAVPTSGGSHAFVVLDPHPEVTVGGG